MSPSRPGSGAGTAQRRGSPSVRLVRFWRELPSERRLAALAAIGLFLTLFLPWYQETVIASGLTSLRSVSASLTGWGAFSFVEAAVLLVAAAVLMLLFIRAEGGAFHVPGGDGGVITAAGFWTCVLIVWRMFDKEGTTGHGQYATTAGIEWGIFVALGVAAMLTYAGSRIRHAHEPEPPLPGERDAGSSAAADRSARRAQAAADRPARDRSAARPRPSSRGPEMEVDDTWTAEPAVRRVREPRSEAETRIMGSPPAPPAPAASPAVAQPAAPVPARRRVRPRSVGEPAAEHASEPGRRPHGQTPPPEAVNPSPPSAPEPASGADRPRRTRGLDRSEIRELDIAEPPTARLGRSRPRAPQSDDPDDQLTLRLKGPD